MIKRLRWLLPALTLVMTIILVAQSGPDARVVMMDTTLALHPEPNTSNPPVMYLDPQTPLYVVGRSSDGDWLEVRHGNTLHGWVPTEFVELNIALMDVPITDGTDRSIIAAPFTPEVAANIRRVYAIGQEKGNRPDVFSKVGDSITVSRSFLDPIGYGQYDLQGYTHLQMVIDYYSRTPARTLNSFSNVSKAAGVGWAAWGVLDPNLAGADCGYYEMPLVCEYRLVRPSIALIMFGSNDLGYRSPEQFEENLLQIIAITQEYGVIPVLSTMPPRPQLPYKSAQFNAIIRNITEALDLPLWDYAAALETVPGYGLISDGVHPSSPPNGYTDVAVFTERNLNYGYVVRNLTALEMLHRVLYTISTAD